MLGHHLVVSRRLLLTINFWHKVDSSNGSTAQQIDPYPCKGKIKWTPVSCIGRIQMPTVWAGKKRNHSNAKSFQHTHAASWCIFEFLWHQHLSFKLAKNATWHSVSLKEGYLTKYSHFAHIGKCRQDTDEPGSICLLLQDLRKHASWFGDTDTSNSNGKTACTSSCLAICLWMEYAQKKSGGLLTDCCCNSSNFDGRRRRVRTLQTEQSASVSQLPASHVTMHCLVLSGPQ